MNAVKFNFLVHIPFVTKYLSKAFHYPSLSFLYTLFFLASKPRG